MFNSSRDGRKLVLLTAATIAAIGTAAAPAQASVSINYSCELPYVGTQSTVATVDLDYPSAVPTGTIVPGQPVSTKVSYNANGFAAFEIVGAATVSGEHRLGTTITTTSSQVFPPLTLPQAVPTTPVVANASGGLDITGAGTTPGLVFTQPAAVTIKATALASTLTLRDDSGAVIQMDESVGAGDDDPNTITPTCVQTPGQAGVLDTFTAGTIANAPLVSQILPRTVKANKKTNVVITGKRLANATSVKVGGVAATFTALNNTTITAKVPALAAGTYPLVVTTPGGDSAVTTQTTIKYVG